MKKETTSTIHARNMKPFASLFIFLLLSISTLFAQTPVCNAHFIYAVSPLNAAQVAFVASQNPPHSTYVWNFGDGTGYNHAAATHTYAQSGAYTACLTVTDSVGGTILCTASWCDTIHITIPPPVCNAHFVYYHGSNPLNMHFVSSGNPAGTTYAWNFGDGSNSSQQFPQHTYAQGGVYPVCLTVTDSSAGIILCTASWCDSVRINTPPPPPPPVCNAHFYHSPGGNPAEIHFSGASNPSGTTYAWSFGDNTTSGGHSPTHTYTQAGTYYACLTVTDSANGIILCTATWCDSVHVVIPVPVCNAHFTHYAGSHPGEVHFSGASNPSGTTYAWSFGDNTTAGGHSPAHTYTGSGTYYACLTVTDSASGIILCTATWCDSVHVVIPPPVCNAHFHHNPTASPAQVHFYASTNPPGSTFSWSFGDGTTGSGNSLNHTYTQFGTYYVCLTVTDSAGGIVLCTATQCDSVHVNAPVCNAEFDHSCGHHAMNIHFEAEQEHHSSFFWDFGDTTTSTLDEPTHQYAQPGAYNVCLTVTDSLAGSVVCTSTWCDTVFAGSHHGGCHTHHHDNDRLSSYTDLTNTDAVVAMIYPNPMSETAVLHLENTTGNVTFSIFESSGRLVMTKENLTDGDFQLNRKDLGEGMYFYRINDSNGNVVNGKFIVE